MTSGARELLDAATAVPLLTIERSGVVESVHSGAAAIVAPTGAVTVVGGGERLVYPRSALKPFQTVAALRAGAVLDARQLVIVTSSHVGAPEHVAAVREVLGSVGLTADALQTPAAWPSSSREARAHAAAGGGPEPILMGCSGNHAGMLAGAVAGGHSTGDYLAAAHPIHAGAAAVIAETSGFAPTRRGVDGCGGPVWAIPLSGLASGFSRVLALHPELGAAVLAHPDLIEGRGTMTTEAIRSLGVVAKSGAEGVWTAVAPDGTAVAVKTLDGGWRAGPLVGIALLDQVGAIDHAAATELLTGPFAAVHGGGAVVGALRVVAEIT